MRTVGILGGLGPESTIDYYRGIIARYCERAKRPEYPHIVINSLDVDKGIAMLDAGQLEELTNYLSAGIEALAEAGAEFGLIAANTPHIVFDEVEGRSPIPLVSIVRAAADHARALGMKRVGLLGTGFTMRADFYRKAFERAEIMLVVPAESERDYVHGIYIGQLLKNQFLPETRNEVLRIANRMKTEDGLQAILLAGTELPILLRGCTEPDITFLDTTAIHVEAIVDELLR